MSPAYYNAFVGFRAHTTGRGARRRTPYSPGRSKGRREPAVRASPLKTPPTTKGICLWNPELLPCPNQSIFKRLATKGPQHRCGLFSLFTLRHKLQALYIELSGRKFNGKLLRNFITLAISCYRCTRKVTQIFYTEQEPMFKPLSLCQLTEVATLRGYPRGNVPLCRPGLLGDTAARIP